MLEYAFVNLKSEYEKAVDLFGEGRHEEAAQAFKDILGKDAAHWDAYESLGMVYYKMGRLDEAIQWTEKLAELRPDYPMAHTNLSVFYMKKGDKERAEVEKAKAVVLGFSKPKG